MDPATPRVGLSFQAKVLLPVLTALVVMPAITLWIVNVYMRRQMEDEARQALQTADAVFLNSLEIRSRNLVSRFRNSANDPRFKAVALKGDPRTLTASLREMLDELNDDSDMLIFTTDRGQRLASAQRDPSVNVADLEHAAAGVIRQASDGEPGEGTISTANRTYNVVAVPVLLSDSGQLIGNLTIFTRLTEAAIQELKSLTHADLVLFANGLITASTIRQPDLPPELLAPLASSSPSRRVMPLDLANGRYLALAGTYELTGPGRGFGYVLLSSYEQRFNELARTRLMLLAVSLAGILVSGLAIWILIRRVTQPLLLLRDNAEAVGRGDFTRRITEFSDDECGAVAVAFNDMTENLQASRADLEKAVGTLKTTQAQLLQSEKLSAVGQFVAGVAHELNNPLTSVIGFSELLQATSTNAKEKDHLNHIVRNAIRCHKIVHSLLGFSRQHEPERKPLRLNDVADAVIEIVAYDMRVNNVALVREYDPNLPMLLGDSHQLQQVVLNIMSNARQALESFRRDGQITLRTGTTDDRVWIRIIDNGPGISAENLKKIFDPFFTTKPQGKGTGLGLSLSYGIVQEHRGTIRAESQPGIGTEFILEFPIAENIAPASIFRPDSKPPMAIRPPSLRLLVIDDEESILRLVQEILASEGHKVEAMTSGQAAFDQILAHDYDVILSDWKMPGLNGINLYQELLQRKPEAAQRMIFMTGDVIKESFQQFLKQYARTCLPKPFALREFHAAIAGILKIR
jgi:two-component system NtrC family sensor kinase